MTREEAINKWIVPAIKNTWRKTKCEEIMQALEQELKIFDTLNFAIDASNGDTNYFVGFRNGLRYSKSLIDGEEPQFERCAEQEPAIASADILKIIDKHIKGENKNG